MSLEKNKAIILSLYEADNKKDLAILDDVISLDFFDPTFKLRGPEELKQFENAFFKGFPDWIKLLKTLLLREIKYGFVLQAQGHIKANGVD